MPRSQKRKNKQRRSSGPWPTPPPSLWERWRRWVPVAAAVVVFLSISGGGAVVLANRNRGADSTLAPSPTATTAAAVATSTGTTAAAAPKSNASTATGASTSTATIPTPTVLAASKPTVALTALPFPTLAPSPTPKPADAGIQAFRIIGPADAPITMVEFTDFQCSFCKKYHLETYPLILDAYKGKIRYIFRHFPQPAMLGHEQSPKAAEATMCAGDQGKFWEYVDALFKYESRLSLSDLPRIAETLKLDRAAFQSCLDSGKYAGDVERDLAEGRRVGVEGTPSFLVNGYLAIGARPFASFKQAIDQMLASSGR